MKQIITVPRTETEELIDETIFLAVGRDRHVYALLSFRPDAEAFCENNLSRGSQVINKTTGYVVYTKK